MLKKWWNSFKEDLIFNIISIGISSILILADIYLFIVFIERMSGIC